MITPSIFANTGQPEGIAALGLDPLAIIAQILTFIVLFVIIKKFALSKIVDVLETRRNKIESSLDNAEKLDKQNKEAEKRMKELLKQARLEAESIIDGSRSEAKDLADKAETQARDRAKRIIDDAKSQIESEATKVSKQLRSEMLELVSRTTEAVLGSAVSDEIDKSLVNKAIDDIGSSDKKDAGVK